MDTKSKIHEALSMLGAASKTSLIDGVVADALNDLAAMQKENASLREQLRLTNDKMAEQVRQARWEVATEALSEFVDLRTNKRAQACLEQIKRENAPKD
jgi:hypothetical protein